MELWSVASEMKIALAPALVVPPENSNFKLIVTCPQKSILKF